MRILTPISVIFDSLSKFVTGFFKVKPEPAITEDELIEAIDSLADSEQDIHHQSKLLHSALKFDDAIVWDIMTPLKNVVSIDVDMKPEEAMTIIRTNKFSRLPIYQTTPDNIVGVLDVRSYIKKYLAFPQKTSIRMLMKKTMMVEDTKRIDDLFNEMTQSRTHICIVGDSHGSIVGIVTMEDILEQLVGEIWDEGDELPVLQSQQKKEDMV